MRSIFIILAIAFLAGAYSTACDSDDDIDCSSLRSEEECMVSGCAWAQKSTYTDNCEVTESREACIPIAGTEAGCNPTCDDETLRFVRMSEEGPDSVFISEEFCGMRPDQSWTTCLEAGPNACGCTCE